MSWLARVLEHLRHGAAPDERQERINKAVNHAQTMERADALVASAEETLHRARTVRLRTRQVLADYDRADQAFRRRQTP